jgi:LysR family transcriptional regulator, glycine cleavage system transcriptional activator
MSHLPSLQTLRAFEAAGRLNSYSRAAEELGLTHSAVSHRIRELEAVTGKRLFRREGNVMTLTPEGQLLHAQVRQGLSLLEQAFVGKARPVSDANRLVVTAVPSLASTWLFARLPAFRAAHPDIDLTLLVSETLADFRRDGVDVGVRLGRGDWAGLEAVKMFDETLRPVCTPAYRDRLQLREPCDLARATLLRNPWTAWSRWFKAAGLDWPEPASGPGFDDALLLLRAAMQGDGVALGRQWLVADELAAGRLVYPFEPSVADDFAYWLVWPTRGRERPPAKAFREWAAALAAKERAAA